MGSFPGDLKPIDQYFGYSSIKEAMKNHFRYFATGTSVKPMMLVGPPGVGKTRLTLSYAKEFANLSVVVAPSSKIDEMGSIVELLKGRPHRYVLLFDDVDNVDDIKWTEFRTIFEGAGEKAPENILLVITSNEELPENVTTRGVKINFPDISDPKASVVEVLGIIDDYFAKSGAPSNAESLSRFVIHDFFGGEVFGEINRSAGRPEPHTFQRSPRGLIDYLDSLVKTGRARDIYDRMKLYEEGMAEMEGMIESLENAAAEAGLAESDSPDPAADSQEFEIEMDTE